MLFNSAIFLLLFCAVYVLYWFLPTRGKHALILLASGLFYAWYSISFLILFIGLILFNYWLSTVLLKHKKKWILVAGLIVDLGNLFVFKYFYLVVQTVGAALGLEYVADLKDNWRSDHGFEIFLPIAISFYTFQIVAYLIDCYRGTIDERIPLRKYALFILFFPQFIAGPIMRASDFIPQIDSPVATREKMLQGSILLLQGVVKKVLIADPIGAAIGVVFKNPEAYSAPALLMAIIGFAGQVFADFSGYTDMARGMARLLGFEIPENFAGPYFARSTQEFWRRWHITLSSWLRDYIYIPLGGSRASEVRVYMNLIITMGLGGAWHGASWTMLAWGVYVGIDLAVERWVGRMGIQILPNNRVGDVLRWLRTQGSFCVGIPFFASQTLADTWDVWTGIFTWQGGEPMANIGGVLGLSLLAYILNLPQYFEASRAWVKARPKLCYAIVGFGTFVVGFLVFLYGDTGGNFIYFEF